MAQAPYNDHLSQVVDFIQDLGIGVRVEEGPVEGFIPGVAVEHGTLVVGSNATVDGLLHEAGHLALVPAPFRAWMDGNLARGQRRMFDALAQVDLDPDRGIARHAMQCSDTEVTAWAFAAGRALGLPDELVITDANYQDEGAQIRLMCQMGAYMGIRGLVAAGLCEQGAVARQAGRPEYPTMRAWVQDGPYPEWSQEPTVAVPRRMRRT